jgi:hypothetical protein
MSNLFKFETLKKDFLNSLNPSQYKLLENLSFYSSCKRYIQKTSSYPAYRRILIFSWCLLWSCISKSIFKILTKIWNTNRWAYGQTSRWKCYSSWKARRNRFKLLLWRWCDVHLFRRRSYWKRYHKQRIFY